jgi:hypothetical protein
VRYQTRHAQCLEMLDAWGEQVPHGWVTGDDELGRHTGTKHGLAQSSIVPSRGTPVSRL